MALSEHFAWQTPLFNHISKFSQYVFLYKCTLQLLGDISCLRHTHPSTDLLMLCESGFVMDVRGHQVKLVLFCQNPQQQDNCPTSTLANPVVDHLAWEWQLLETQALKYIVIRKKTTTLRMFLQASILNGTGFGETLCPLCVCNMRNAPENKHLCQKQSVCLL